MTDQSPPLLHVADLANRAPTSVDVARVQALMLWPDDLAAQVSWVNACVVADLETMDLDDLDAPELRVLVGILLKSPPRMADLQPLTHRPTIIGMAAGYEVLRGLDAAKSGLYDAPFSENTGKNAWSTRADVEPSRVKFADLINRTVHPIVDGRQLAISVSTLNKELPRFRPVAHLWAAYEWAGRHEPNGFPCSVRGLGQLLADADWIRRHGAELKTHPKSRGSIIDDRAAYRVPPGLDLPHPTLAFQDQAANMK